MCELDGCGHHDDLPPIVVSDAARRAFLVGAAALPLAAVLAVLLRRGYESYADSVFYTFVPAPVASRLATSDSTDPASELAMTPVSLAPAAEPESKPGAQA